MNEEFVADVGAGKVPADTITLDVGQAEAVVAEMVTMHQSGANSVTAGTVQATQSGFVSVEADHIEVNQGGILLAHGQMVTLNQGRANVVIADHAELENTFVAFLAAQELSGDARVLFDVKAAAVFGLVTGLVIGLLRLLAGRK
jgi:hypothetical protein